jgi:hypothetical protein
MRRWSATVAAEQSKLTRKEKDWQLHGDSNGPVVTRTRNGGNGRPNLERVRELLEVVSSSSSSSDGEWRFIGSDTDSQEEEEEDQLKPSPTRVILDVEALKITLQENS